MKSLRRLVIGLSLLTAGLTASRQCAAQTLEDVSGQVKIATSCFTDTGCQVTATNIGGSFLPGPLLLEVVVDDPTSTVTVLGGPYHLLAPVGLEAGGTAVITLVLNNPNKTFFGLRTSVKIPEKLIGTPLISPKLIPAATPTMVTVTVSIARPQSVISARLKRLNGTQVVDLGLLHDDGLNGDLVAGDGIFTIQLPFTESSAGAALLYVSVDLFGQFGELVAPSPFFALTVSASRARTLDTGRSSHRRLHESI